MSCGPLDVYVHVDADVERSVVSVIAHQLRILEVKEVKECIDIAFACTLHTANNIVKGSSEHW